SGMVSGYFPDEVANRHLLTSGSTHMVSGNFPDKAAHRHLGTSGSMHMVSSIISMWIPSPPRHIPSTETHWLGRELNNLINVREGHWDSASGTFCCGPGQ